MYPGEYAQPLLRTTNVHCPAISGYATARLRLMDPVRPSVSGEETTDMLVVENVGSSHVWVRLAQTSDRSVSGTRLDVVSGISLVPGGRSTKTYTTVKREFLELWTTQGSSFVRMQIVSQRRWEQMAFDKDADATFYPTALWQAKPIPEAASVS